MNNVMPYLCLWEPVYYKAYLQYDKIRVALVNGTKYVYKFGDIQEQDETFLSSSENNQFR